MIQFVRQYEKQSCLWQRETLSRIFLSCEEEEIAAGPET